MGYKVKAPELMPDINVVPMADIMLVMLIIFMVITPMLQKGFSVEMAKTDNPRDMKEADKVSTKLKQAIFSSELDLSRKTHLRNFVEHIDNIPDWAEDVADRLAIYAIKRTV